MLRVGFLWLQSMDFCCSGFSSLRAPALVSVGSVVTAHRLSCFMTRGMFQDQGSNPFSLHGKADSQPLDYQGSPSTFIY